jgi:transcriptional regulator with XRE-family HTH domain
MDDQWPTIIDPDGILRINLRRLRKGRRDRDPLLTQQQVATGMTQLGFDWVRQTVGQIETGDRRVTAAELIGLALVLGKPPIWFLLPHGADHHTQIAVGNRHITAEEWTILLDPQHDTQRIEALEQTLRNASFSIESVRESIKGISPSLFKAFGIERTPDGEH